MDILRVPIVVQEHEYDCGPASLKSVLSYHGRNCSVEDLCKLAGTSTDGGTDHDGMVKAVIAVGHDVWAESSSHQGLECVRWFLNQHYPVIVGWWLGRTVDWFEDPLDRWYYSRYCSKDLEERKRLDSGHYSVVVAMDESTVTLMDPLDSRDFIKLSLEDFRSRWFDTDEDDYHRVDCWYLVVGKF
jgi:predicted double-glycine peptidase